MAKTKPQPRRQVTCYLCHAEFDVSARTMSTTCPGCNKAIKIEDVVVKSYLPVIALQTCGRITITKRGRVAAKEISSGEGIRCEGAMEGAIQTKGAVALGPKSSWKGKKLDTPNLTVADGAELLGEICVPQGPRVQAPAEGTVSRGILRRKRPVGEKAAAIVESKEETTRKTTNNAGEAAGSSRVTPQKTAAKKAASDKKVTGKTAEERTALLEKVAKQAGPKKATKKAASKKTRKKS